MIELTGIMITFQSLTQLERLGRTLNLPINVMGKVNNPYYIVKVYGGLTCVENLSFIAVKSNLVNENEFIKMIKEV